MTREEAIEQLQNCKDLIRQDGQDYLDERDIPLLDMAIEALSADAYTEQQIRDAYNCGYSCGKEQTKESLSEETSTINEKHQLSGETPTDLISRADAMAEFREWVKRANENGKTPTWNDAVSLIGSLPSAELPKGDLISRAEAFGAVQDHFNDDGFKGYDDGQKMMDRIKALPSADAESVVRCKDCRHRDLFSCPLADNYFQKDEDYCSWGERREP